MRAHTHTHNFAAHTKQVTPSTHWQEETGEDTKKGCRHTHTRLKGHWYSYLFAIILILIWWIYFLQISLPSSGVWLLYNLQEYIKYAQRRQGYRKSWFMDKLPLLLMKYINGYNKWKNTNLRPEFSICNENWRIILMLTILQAL